MPRLVTAKRFQKKLKAFLLRRPDMTTVIEERLDILRTDPWDARLKTHRLSGTLRNCHACAISYEYRLIFSIAKNMIELLAIGTHDEVY